MPHFASLLSQDSCPLGLPRLSSLLHWDLFLRPAFWAETHGPDLSFSVCNCSYPTAQGLCTLVLHPLGKQISSCFVCASYQFNRNFVKIVSWLFINKSFKISVMKRDQWRNIFGKYLTYWHHSDFEIQATFTCSWTHGFNSIHLAFSDWRKVLRIWAMILGRLDMRKKNKL